MIPMGVSTHTRAFSNQHGYWMLQCQGIKPWLCNGVQHKLKHHYKNAYGT